MDLQANPVTRVYAEALFRAAKERGVVADINENLQGLAEMMQGNPEFQHFLGAPMIDVLRKKAAVQKSFQGNVDDMLVDFLCLLIDKNRADALEGVAQQYRVLADKDAGRVRISATTSHPLSDEQRTVLQDSLQQKLQSDCTIEAKVDTELVGGMILRIGDKLYDGSVRRQLQRVGDQLMRSSGYEN